MNGAAALLVLRLVLPICDAGPEPDVRAEVYVVCPSCPQRTWVVVMSGWCYRDTAPEFTDSLTGQLIGRESSRFALNRTLSTTPLR